ncbi:MAG TPA: hypothetical protein VM656_01915, partial [Pyrinomonadaceae bacterium]|nr:hypothetical protein [Pyrinomonadaceae bacterium]
TFAELPDVPVSKFVLNMRGGKRGLLINSRDICSRAFRVQAQIGAQNGRRYDTRPVVKAECGKKKKRKGKKKRR